MTHDNPQQTVLAYLAGIIDGEGWIRIAKATNPRLVSHNPVIGCGMTQPDAVELLHETFGGSIRWAKATCRNASPCKPVRHWYLNSTNDVATMLRLVHPYLHIKKEQANLVLDFCMNKVDGRKTGGVSQGEQTWREELYHLVKKLNQRGVAATTE